MFAFKCVCYLGKGETGYQDQVEVLSNLPVLLLQAGLLDVPLGAGQPRQVGCVV